MSSFKRSYPKYVRLRNIKGFTNFPTWGRTLHILSHDPHVMYHFIDKTKCGILVVSDDQLSESIPDDHHFSGLCKGCSKHAK